MCVLLPQPLFLAVLTHLCSGFEQANQPTVTDIDRRNILNFCIVGKSLGVRFHSVVHLRTKVADQPVWSSRRNCTIC